MSGANVRAAQEAWGDEIRDWIIALAEECDRGGQAGTARRVGLAKSTINQILRRSYNAKLDGVEQKVRGALMGKTVQCPILDEITIDLCLDNQRRPFSAANPIRVALHRTCPTCPHKRTRPAPKSDTTTDTSSPRE